MKLYSKKRKSVFKNKKKTLYYNNKIKSINYKDINIIKKFLNSSFRIIPAKISNINHIYQNKLKKYIKYLKYLSILPYIYKFEFEI